MKPTNVRFIVLAGLCAAAALAYFVRNGTGPAESTIRADLDLSKGQSGMLTSAFFWSYALFQIPAAMVAQRIGYRKALSVSAVLWSIATAGMASGNFGIMFGSRILMGMGQAGLVPLGLSALARWMPRARQASASGAFSGFMSFGSIVGAPLTAWLVITVGWRWMFVMYAIPAVLWALWFASWYREQPSEHPGTNEAERLLIGHTATTVQVPELVAPWAVLLGSPAMWLLCAQQFCRAAGYIFFASWFATYLQEARGVTILGSGWLTMLPFIADLTGCLSGGVLSDAVLRRTGSPRLARQGVSAIALLMCAGLIFCARFAADPMMAVLVISAGMFCAATANPCLGATIMTLGGPHVARLSAANNMCGNFGAAAFPVAVPWLLHHAGGWNAVLVGFGALYIIAAVFWLMIRTNGSLFDRPAPAT